MTLTTTQSIVVRATAREVLELVADLDRYRLVDTKIVAVLKGCDLSTGDTGTTRYRGRLRGIPSPIDSNDVTLTRWSRIDFVGSPGSWVRRLVDFHGWVTCEPTDDGTLVTHGEEFRFYPPGRWVMEPWLRTWLQHDLDHELHRLAAAVEHTTA
jgi:Polyketide cyclase / dehydrase and lipid transport